MDRRRSSSTSPASMRLTRGSSTADQVDVLARLLLRAATSSRPRRKRVLHRSSECVVPRGAGCRCECSRGRSADLPRPNRAAFHPLDVGTEPVSGSATRLGSALSRSQYCPCPAVHPSPSSTRRYAASAGSCRPSLHPVRVSGSPSILASTEVCIPAINQLPHDNLASVRNRFTPGRVPGQATPSCSFVFGGQGEGTMRKGDAPR